MVALVVALVAMSETNAGPNRIAEAAYDTHSWLCSISDHYPGQPDMSRVVHFEIHASDPERVIEFHTAPFGSNCAPRRRPAAYGFIRTAPDTDTEHAPPGIDGGLILRRGAVAVEGQPVDAFVCMVDVCTVGVSDVSAIMDKAVQTGGNVAVARMAVHSVGWLGYPKNPDGNIFGAMQNDPAAA